MANKRLEEVTTGMVLASDLTASDGRLLLPAGVVLEERHLQLLQRMDVEVLDVSPSSMSLDEATLNEIEEYVRDFYLYVDPDFSPMMELFHLSLEKTAQAVAGGWSLPSISDRRASTVEHLEDLFLHGMGGPEVIVEHETELASFPDIYFRIKEILQDESASADRVARVVSTDMSLAAKLLQLVNSPLYGFTQAIDSISRAVALVGAKELSTLALGISAINYFKDIPKELIDMKQFWRHSISCGIFAKILADSQVGLSPERFFIAGLLHDVGRLILFKKLPYASTEAMLYARENSVPLVEAEQAVVGFTHTDISTPLLEAWQFPQGLADMINFHHDPMRHPNPLEAGIIHISDNLANAAQIAEGGMYVLPGINAEVWNLLGLDEETFLQEAFAQYEKQIDILLESFTS